MFIQQCVRVIFDSFGCPEECFKEAFVIANMKYPLCHHCFNKFTNSEHVRKEVKKYSNVIKRPEIKPNNSLRHLAIILR